ncbi:MAG TPA: hypothetical protein VFF79_02855 [Conexibacter sp.]|jgi:hypothetical protein|nr:hypothetical protein [Conexibacter sp.]
MAVLNARAVAVLALGVGVGIGVALARRLAPVESCCEKPAAGASCC